jgi:hypothetical protein
MLGPMSQTKGKALTLVPPEAHSKTKEKFMAKTAKGLFSKWRKRKEARDRRRKNEQTTRHAVGRNSTHKGTDRLEAALLYAAKGLPVVPLHGKKKRECTCGDPDCEQAGNHPRTERGMEDATTDPVLIEKYWTKWPKAKIGVPAGTRSRVIAVVVEGTAGQRTIRNLEEKEK